jgi:hypothetical protein
MNTKTRLQVSLVLSVVIVASSVTIAPVFIKYWRLRNEAVWTTELLTAHGYEVTTAAPCLRKFEGVVVNLAADSPVDECKISDILRKAEIMSGVEITVRTKETIVDQFYFWPSQPDGCTTHSGRKVN